MSFIENGIEHITPEELLQIYENKSRKEILIDVREPEEYVAGHIPGVTLIPMNDIPERMTELDKNKSYVFICRSGGRSANVVYYLQQNGFDNVKNYYGGMLQWQGPVEQGE